MAGFWDELNKNTRRNLAVGTGQLDKHMKGIDDELEKQKGIGPAILRAFVKVGRLFVRLILGGIGEVFPSLAVSFETVFSGRAMEVPKQSWDDTIDGIAKSLQLDPQQINILKSYYQTLEGTSPIVQGISTVSLFLTIFKFLMVPGMSQMLQTMNVKFSPNVPSAGEVLGARALDPKLDDRIWGVLERNGFKKEDIELMFAATYQRIDPSMLKEIFFRTDKPKEWLQHRLTELGFTPERVKEVMSIMPTIPPVQDMIRFMAKEAYEPEMISHFGLGANTPEQLYTELAKHGLSPDDSDRYWSSHWEHPGLQTVLQMFHRGIIEWETVELYFGVVEIPPFWRDKIRDVAHNPYTRVDVRRMHDMGVLTDEELKKSYMDLGYDDEKSDKMVEWTIKYNERSDREITRVDVLDGFKKGYMSGIEAVELLQDIGYTDDFAGYLIAKAELDQSNEETDEKVDTIKEYYQSLLISEVEARSGLIKLELTNRQVNLFIDRWKVKRLIGTKLPSKTDNDKFFKSHIITEQLYRNELLKLGYSTIYVDRYIALAKLQLEEV